MQSGSPSNQPLRNSEVFDLCLTAYHACQAQMNGRPTTRPEVIGDGFQTRRIYGNAGAEFCADFTRTGESIVAHQSSPKARLELWRIYYLADRPYKEAVARVGVSPSTFQFWSRDIAYAVGAAIRKRRIQPPGGYFFWLLQSENKS